MRPRIAIAAAALAVAGCTITESVDPVAAGAVESVCIETNESVLMEGFLPELDSLVRRQGVATRIVAEPAPPDCRDVLKYTANWRWDMAMYLHYAKIDVLRDGSVIGSAEYDARSGGGNMGKFGRTEEKLAPLIQQLFPRPS